MSDDDLAEPIRNPLLTRTERPVSPTGAMALSDRAARGMAYTLGQTLGGKIVTLAGQVVLAWLLDERDYGYVGLAFVVAAFAAPIQQGGIADILIRRGRHFDRWASPAFWLSVSLGLFSMALMIAAAPVAAAFFDDRRLIGLILVLSLQNVPQSLATLPEARLRTQLRFRLLAAVGLLLIVLQTTLSIVFAWAGLESYSFILPLPIVAIARAVILWIVAPRMPIRARPSTRRWSVLLGPNALLLATLLCYAVTSHGDYVILGWLFSKEVVGQYFWAFNLSTQSLQALALSVGGILLPSLAQLQREPQRQFAAFLRAAKMLAAIAIPACLLQAAIADPLVRVVFAHRWHPAIPVLQILSVGWAFFFVIYSAASLMKAQGRYMTFFLFSLASAAGFLAMVYLGATRAAAVGSAIGVAVYALLSGPLSLHLAIRPLGGRARDVLSVFAPPLFAAGAATAAGWIAGSWMPATAMGHVGRATIVLAVTSLLYVPLLRLVAPATFTELLTRVQSLRGSSAPTAPEVTAV